MATPNLPITARISEDQRRAVAAGRALTKSDGQAVIHLSTSDEPTDFSFIYVYNVLEMAHVVEQPPLFPRFHIPACPKGERFSVTLLPRYIKNKKFRYGGGPNGSDEVFYHTEDGRKSATSLLNPEAFPGTQWESQVSEWSPQGNENTNLNHYGVFWSLESPESEEFERQLKTFKNIARKTMEHLVKSAERLATSPKTIDNIGPRHHFAMDYLGKQAPWHTSMDIMTTCPNCGDRIKEGIAYHRNSFSERCVVDWKKTVEAGAAKREDVPLEMRWWNDALTVGAASDNSQDEQIPNPQPKKKGNSKKTA